MTGRDVIDLNRVMEFVQFAYQQQELMRRGPNYEVDEFGFDPQWTESFLSVFMVLYRDYWRVETTGIENVPATGRALLVSNHAGVLPWDGTMIKTAVFAEHSHPRHVRALVASLFMGMPMLSWFLRRTGQTVGHPDDTRRLLERDELVLVFPEGVERHRQDLQGSLPAAPLRSRRLRCDRDPRRARRSFPCRWSDRKRSTRWSRTSPLWPGSLGLPYFPITPFWPWLGPLGMIPLPSKWRIQFHAPIHVEDYPPEAADDNNLVMALVGPGARHDPAGRSTTT